MTSQSVRGWRTRSSGPEGKGVSRESPGGKLLAGELPPDGDRDRPVSVWLSDQPFTQA